MLATSLSLVVIFVPIAFMGGIVGRFFSSFGLTVAFAVMMSLFVSFTLTPMLCSRFLKLEPAPAGAGHQRQVEVRHLLPIDRRRLWRRAQGGDASQVPGRGLDGRGDLQHGADRPSHGHLADPARRSKRIRNQRDHARGLQSRADEPAHRRAGIADLEAAREPSTSLRPSARPKGAAWSRAKETSRGGRSTSGSPISKSGTPPCRSAAGGTFAGHVRRFFAGAEFDQFQIQQEARKFLEDYPDLRVSVNDVSPFQGGRRPQTFQVSLAGPDLSQLAAYGDQLIAELKKEGGIVDLDTTLSLRKPEVQVVIDREAASDLGVPVGTIADTLRVLVGGLPVSKFREGDEQYDVWLRAESGKRSTSQDLYQITFPSPAVGLVKLASLAKLNEDRGPTEIERLSRERIVTVVGNPEGIALGEAITQAERILKEMNLPPQYSYVFTGQAKTLGETGYYFLVAFTLVDHVHVSDPGRPVRELDAADRHPDGAAGHDSVRDAVAGIVPHADGSLCDVRPVHAGGNRQEKWHPAGRRHQPASGQGLNRGTTRSSRPTTRGCGRS